LAVDDSFAQTSQKLEELLGRKVSERTVERVVHQVGSVALGQQAQELESFFQERKIPQAEAKPEKERNWQSCISTSGITNKKCVMMFFEAKVLI